MRWTSFQTAFNGNETHCNLSTFYLKWRAKLYDSIVLNVGNLFEVSHRCNYFFAAHRFPHANTHCSCVDTNSTMKIGFDYLLFPLKLLQFSRLFCYCCIRKIYIFITDKQLKSLCTNRFQCITFCMLFSSRDKLQQLFHWWDKRQSLQTKAKQPTKFCESSETCSGVSNFLPLRFESSLVQRTQLGDDIKSWKS